MNRLITLGTIALLSFAIAVTAMLASGKIPRWGEWYSYDINYRLQTEALLHGHTTISDSPRAHLHDWAWGRNGMEQVWGLGVPLLRIPFEVFARIIGHPQFPDRLVMLFYLSVVVFAWILVGVELCRVTHLFSPLGLGAGIVLVSLSVASTPLITLLRTRMLVLEEAVLYLNLVIFFVLALSALLVLGKGRTRLPVIIGCLAGLSGFVRPTALIYGGVIVATLMCWMRCRGYTRRQIISLASSAILGVILLCISNFQRFGSPLEFGHSLNLSFPLNDYILKFESPFRQAPLGEAMRELRAVALHTRTWIYTSNFSPKRFENQSPVPRFRELYFTVFEAWLAWLVLFGWLCGVMRIIRERRGRCASPESPANDLIEIFTIISIASLGLLAVFYLRSPSITSRYIADFIPAVALALVVLSVTMVRAFRKPIFQATALTFVLGLSAAWTLFSPGRIAPHRHHAPVNRAEIEKHFRVSKFWGTSPDIPSGFQCGRAGREALQNLHAKSQGQGWNVNGDCGVNVMSTFFLPASQCVVLRVTANDEEMAAIRVKSGLNFLRRTQVVRTENGESILRFCGERRTNIDPQVVFVGWITVTQFPNPPGTKLHEIFVQ
jgi:hypothetical protein